MNCEFKRKLPIPMEIKERYPITKKLEAIKAQRDKAIADVFIGNSEKFLLIIGPCSADNEDSVLDYLCRLSRVQEKVADKLVIIPRVFTNKPRTTGSGYKGLLHQPNPHGKPDMLLGITKQRELHLRAIEETGLTTADEMLYTEDYRYLSDLLSYVTVGARSVEDQQHRLTASAITVPVGMKNPTGGDLSVMLNSILCAHKGHTFIYRGWEVESYGNSLSHAVLRGMVNQSGQTVPNYHYDDLMKLYTLYNEYNLSNPSVIVDANHANSGKDFSIQPQICLDVLASRRKNADIGKFVKGLMVESYIVDGCQKVDGTTYGQSITDPCLGWEKSEKLIYQIADLL